MRYLHILPLFITLITVLLSGCPKQNDREDTGETDRPAETENTGNWLVQQQRFESLRHDGVVFQSMGNEPFWNVRLFSDETFLFIRLGADTIRGTYSPGFKPADLNSLTFPLATGEGNMILVAHIDSCADSMSGDRFTHKTAFTFRGNDGGLMNYNGCGLFLNDPALNDTYSLSSWTKPDGGEPPFPKGKPRLEFNFHDNTLLGFDGDCEIKGKFEPMGNRIFFKEFDFVDPACRPETRSRFFDHLNSQELDLELIDGILKLKSMDEVLEFRKVD